MRPLIPLLLLSSLNAQQDITRIVHVTISRQDGMARALTGLNFDGYSATLCSGDEQAITIGGGAIWQAAERGGLQPVNLHVAAMASTQTRAKSKWEIAGVLGEELMFDFSIIMGANIINANPASFAGKALRVAPILLTRKLQTFNQQRAKIQPDPVTAFAGDALDPGAVIPIPAGSGICPQRLFLAAPGGPANINVDIPVLTLPAAPLVFVPAPPTR